MTTKPRIIVISGASNGIGEATAKRFIDNGDIVYNLDKQVPVISHNNLKFIECDLSNVTQVESALKYIQQQHRIIDVVICNAALYLNATLEETPIADFEKIVNTNLKGTFLLLKFTLPIMRKHRKGNIVIVGSDQSIIGKPHSAIYGATKAAVAQLAKSTALSCAEDNIRVNCVCPGTVDTPLYRNAINKASKKTGKSLEEIEKEEARQQPLGRIGKPEEIASLIYFLSSDEASFITGSLQVIDGGYTAQ